MRSNEYFIVFPEGDVQESTGRLSINQIVDLNGNPLPLPIVNARIIAFRVEKVTVKENRGGTETYHYLGLVSVSELASYVRR
jgi:hypothetical protein